jgi:uncharacterized membrane protein
MSYFAAIAGYLLIVIMAFGAVSVFAGACWLLFKVIEGLVWLFSAPKPIVTRRRNKWWTSTD